MKISKLKNYLTAKLKSELPKNLTYHGLHHTMEVLDVCNQYIRRLHINAKDAYLLRTAALIHDIGIMWTYNGHEEESVRYSKEILPSFGYSKSDLLKIERMILATQIPQKPKNILEKIICDADLDYLGTNNFYKTGNTLFKEFIAYKVIANEKEWDALQIRFLTNHHYHTDFAIKNREPKKQAFLMELKSKWNIAE